MGRAIEDREYQADDYDKFNHRIHDQLDTLKLILNKDDFGHEPRMIGAELECYLIKSDGDVSPINLQLLEKLKDDQFQSELNQFNLELNLSPQLAKGQPFSAIRNEMLGKFNYLWETASTLDTHPLAIGILPTLKQHHLTRQYMTDEARYRVLCRELFKLRGEPFHIDIAGEDPIKFNTSEVCVEGANTSFQVHLMVDKDKFASTFNAAQLTLPMALAISANSSVFMGNTLWDETRVSLFKQSIDNRIRDTSPWRVPARVTYGHGWVRKSAWELFSESVNLYQPLFPQLFEEESSAQDLPELAELNLHMGSIWPWNRAVYCNKGKGHLRIEFRALPSGPTALDLAANAAFTIGMAVGLEAKMDEYMARIPFRFSEYNFYSAAKNGLDATILWPQKYQHKPVEVPIKNIIDEMLQVAYDGLSQLGVDEQERVKYLNIVKRRLKLGITAARWQKMTYRHLQQTMNKDRACAEMLNIYLENQMSGNPVSEWSQCWR